jgi:hypothetical protein
MSLAVCVSCNCHVRASERVCPHCAADLTVAHSVRSPERRGRAIEVRRVLVATALAGLGLVGCGGRVLNEDVQGSCAQPADPGARCGSTCACGTGGVCQSGQCVSCDCSASEHCDYSGKCQLSGSPYWFVGQTPNPVSGHPCYGSPPFLGVHA